MVNSYSTIGSNMKKMYFSLAVNFGKHAVSESVKVCEYGFICNVNDTKFAANGVFKNESIVEAIAAWYIKKQMKVDATVILQFYEEAGINEHIGIVNQNQN